ncbi:Orn/Lys/Arg family decarboxylase [Halodesulfovibrio marinisediminis]|uniref:Arginine decarboxylase n=1 Tax=Halodesulfovibrio marinisediminis DSM 17456 TaxID=1121457 RepID=A0A1N6I7G6_9BACT|nr:Orn/Lys/Arg decarboxylase N-terminal domain-containing protein [Halodesulfovibrio marinisediminis]SIO27976.1 arginine decarboxylase [Halodesulfovibrio marinisediminis DSM 17456]
MKLTKEDWPILIVSSLFDVNNDTGNRIRELEQALVSEQKCSVIRAYCYEDAANIVHSRADLGAIVIDWDIRSEREGNCGGPEGLLKEIRTRNKHIPVCLLTDRETQDSISTELLAMLDELLWKHSDTVDFLSGRIETLLLAYIKRVNPAFFSSLVLYAEAYKYAWHTPGHMGGEGFLKSPAGVGMYKFFGENVFRSDLSISVPELGSLLDHSGVVGDAENNSAKVFGADITFYVLNGTSNANQIIWRSQAVRDDVAVVDRNCHKSLNYSMVITDIYPIYMQPRRNHLGIIGPCRLTEFSKDTIRNNIKKSKIIPDAKKKAIPVMSALTNSTYDGMCYNVCTIKEQLEKNVKNMHFDEAWYAYAKFHPIYKDHFGMAETPHKHHPPIFCSQSTHKLLTAFSQSSMLHVKHGSHVPIDKMEMNESYMMHGSTSPQYSMIASLDVATKIMEDSGEVILTDCIRDAVILRQKIARMAAEMKGEGSWFFSMWQPEQVEFEHSLVPFTKVPVSYLSATQDPWVLDAKNNWHGFDDIEDNYVMLDPIKLTITTPGLNQDGTYQKSGIPAMIVTDYLIRHGIVCEKTDYYSFLLLNSIGTTKAKQGTLLTALLKFKECYDANTPLSEVFPDLVKQYPHVYKSLGLREHCDAIHAYYKEHNLLGKMHDAFEIIPHQVMKPSDAYQEVVKRNVEYVALKDLHDRVAAVMLVPYPPGIPILMGGEVVDSAAQPILDYLKTREAFENRFPGYESDIHGVERFEKGGKQYFKTLCVKA